MPVLEGGFSVVSWDERPYDRVAGQPRFSHVRSVYELTGSIAGEASLCYLLAYADDVVPLAHFTGFAVITGTIEGRMGSFVMQDVGTYDNDVARGRWTILPGLGRGALREIRGSGHFATGPTGSSYMLDVSF